MLKFLKNLFKKQKVQKKADIKDPRTTLSSKYSIVTRQDYTMFRESLDDLRYESDDTTIIDELYKLDSNFSDAIWNFLRTADTKMHIEGLGVNGKHNKRVESKIYQIIDRIQESQADRVNIDRTVPKIANTELKVLLMRGGCGKQAILDKGWRVVDLKLFDPKWIQWHVDEDGKYFPVQFFQGKYTNLDAPNIFWTDIDRNINNPNPISPFITCTSTVFFRASVMRDLEKIIKRTGYPRIEVTALEEVLMNNAPAHVKQDPELMSAHIKSELSAIQAYIDGLSPESGIVHTDTFEMKYLEANTDSGLDVRSIIEYLDQQISNSMHTLPSILGRGTGASNDTDEVIYQRSITSLQGILARSWERFFNYALRMEGVVGKARVWYEVADLRNPLEIENHLVMRQERLLKQAYLGLITPEELSYKLNGKPLPSSFDENLFRLAAQQKLGLTVTTNDDSGKDNGSYNQFPVERDERAIARDDENNPNNIIRVAERGGGG